MPIRPKPESFDLTYCGSRTASSTYGDVQEGFAEADHIIEFTSYRSENVGRAEPMSVSSWWKDDHFEYAMYGQTNNNIGFVLKDPGGVPQAASYQHPCYNGGGFGTSAILTMWASYIGPLLAQRLMRPVKVLFDIQQSYYSSASDDCGGESFKVGFKDDGTITAIQSQTKYNGATMETGLSHFEENSSVKNLLCYYDGAFTNRPVFFAYRSEQRIAAQGLNWACSRVADALGMDPTEVALLNDGAHGEDRHI
jgi:xanthine dehydrogenase molybdenum-binding subunit